MKMPLDIFPETTLNPPGNPIVLCSPLKIWMPSLPFPSALVPGVVGADQVAKDDVPCRRGRQGGGCRSPLRPGQLPEIRLPGPVPGVALKPPIVFMPEPAMKIPEFRFGAAWGTVASRADEVPHHFATGRFPYCFKSETPA